MPSNDLATPDYTEVQITIIRTMIANIERHLKNVKSPELRDKATELLNFEQQRLNKYRNQYPEYFV